VALDDAELPDGATAAVHLALRDGVFDVSDGSSGRALLHCVPGVTIGRGALGLGALHGTAAFSNLSITR
jgi:hypothetical protein